MPSSAERVPPSADYWLGGGEDNGTAESVEAGQPKPDARRTGRDLEGAQVHRGALRRTTFIEQSGESGEHQSELPERKVQAGNGYKLRRLCRARAIRKGERTFARCRSSHQRNRVRRWLPIALAIQSRFQKALR